jgi:hypothetical protein
VINDAVRETFKYPHHHIIELKNSGELLRTPVFVLWFGHRSLWNGQQHPFQIQIPVKVQLCARFEYLEHSRLAWPENDLRLGLHSSALISPTSTWFMWRFVKCSTLRQPKWKDSQPLWRFDHENCSVLNDPSYDQVLKAPFADKWNPPWNDPVVGVFKCVCIDVKSQIFGRKCWYDAWMNEGWAKSFFSDFASLSNRLSSNLIPNSDSGMTARTKYLEISSAALRIKDFSCNSPILKLYFNLMTQIFARVSASHLHAINIQITSFRRFQWNAREVSVWLYLELKG